MVDLVTQGMLTADASPAHPYLSVVSSLTSRISAADTMVNLISLGLSGMISQQQTAPSPTKTWQNTNLLCQQWVFWVLEDSPTSGQFSLATLSLRRIYTQRIIIKAGGLSLAELFNM